MGASLIERMTQSGLFTESQLTTLAARGYDRARALGILKVTETDFANSRLRIRLERIAEMYRDAEVQLNDPHIGLEVGYAFRVSNFAESGRIYSYCKNFREVVAMNGQYQGLAIHAADISLVEENGRAFVHFEPHFDRPDEMRHITELVFGSYGTAFRWLNWGSGKGNRAVFLRHKRVSKAAIYDQVFDCPVTFGAPYNRLEVFPEILDVNLATSDPERLAMVCDRLDGILDERARTPSSLENAVRAAVRICLVDGKVNLECVATVMSRTPRQLRSELSGADLAFRQILETERKDGFDHLRQRGASFAEIADALGYNDQSALTRAYKRWHGRSPRKHEAFKAK